MPVVDPSLIRSWTPAGDRTVRLGVPLLDVYLDFVAARCRPNTVLATASAKPAPFFVTTIEFRPTLGRQRDDATKGTTRRPEDLRRAAQQTRRNRLLTITRITMISPADFTVSLLGRGWRFSTPSLSERERGLNRGTRSGTRRHVGKIPWPPAGSFAAAYGLFSWSPAGSFATA